MRNAHTAASGTMRADYPVGLLGAMWITYAAYYLCRVNISVAIPALTHSLPVTRSQLGAVLSAFFFAYALGQLVNGHIGSLVHPRRMIALGLCGSAMCNLLYPLTGGIVLPMAVLWAVNGCAQSMGWGPMIRLIASEFPENARGLVAGRLATSYIVGGAISVALATAVLWAMEWRYVFAVPGALCVIIAGVWLLSTRTMASRHISRQPVTPSRASGFFVRLAVAGADTCRRPYVWFVGLALLGLNVVRYGFISWAPSYILEDRANASFVTAFQLVAFPSSGALGAICAVWLADRCFRGGREPIAVAMLCILAGTCLAFSVFARSSWQMAAACLLCSGFFAFGPHAILVAAIPSDAGSQRASSVAGTIDMMGYWGAVITGFGSGYLSDRFGWSAAFWLWVGGALFAAIMVVFASVARRGADANVAPRNASFATTPGDSAHGLDGATATDMSATGQAES